MNKMKLFLVLLAVTFAFGCTTTQDTADNQLVTSPTGTVQGASNTEICVQHYDKNKQGVCSTFDYVLVDDDGARSHDRHKCDVIGCRSCPL